MATVADGHLQLTLEDVEGIHFALVLVGPGTVERPIELELGEARVRQLYRLTLAREPAAAEMAVAMGFISSAPSEGSQLNAWQQFAQVLLLTNEAIFVD